MDKAQPTTPPATKKLADEFSSWPMDAAQLEAANEIRTRFDDLASYIASRTPPHNGRYLALVKTKLEEASFFAVKGIAKPMN